MRALGRGFWIALGVLAVGVILVAGLGGFAPAHRDPVPLASLGPGDVHTNDELSVRILSAEITDDPDLYLEEGEQAVLVELEVTTHWREPLEASGTLGRSLEFADLPEDGPDSVTRTDGGAAGFLQPELRAPLTLRWDVPAGSVEPGSDLHVTIRDGRLRQLEILGDDWTWVDHRPAAELDVPLADRTGLAEEEDE